MLLNGWDDGFCGWWKKAEGSCPLPITEELTEHVPAPWEMGIPQQTPEFLTAQFCEMPQCLGDTVRGMVIGNPG